MATIPLRRGDTYPETWNITAAGGGAYNLTGCTLFFTMKLNEAQADADAAIQHSSGALGGITITSAVGGTATHTITAAEAATLTVGATYKWDVQLVAADGTVKTLEDGDATVAADYTRGTTG